MTPEPYHWRTSSYSGPQGNCVEVGWRKSTYSASQSDCVEVGWRKSSYSGEETNCVEAAVGESVTAVRDTKDRAGGMLTFTDRAWSAFLAQVRAQRFDR